MEVKRIQNEHYSKLCHLLNTYCQDDTVAQKCSSTMHEASYDDNGDYYVYSLSQDMEIIKLDDFTKYFNERRKQLGYSAAQEMSAVDAVCINSTGEWFLIEFKNQPLDNSISSVKKKILSSLWLLFYIYSYTDNSIDDVIKFSKNNVTYIVVYNKEKIEQDAMRIEQKEAQGEHYTPHKLAPYKDYCFKDIYIYTDQQLRNFIYKFDKN